MRAPIGSFDDATAAPDCLDLLTGPVAAAVRAWTGPVPADQLLYVDTDPEIADTAVFVEHYGPELLDASANCVVVAGRRGESATLAACVVKSATRVDVNGVVRKHLGARKASFAPMDTATGETGMEYGGITPSASRPTGPSSWTPPYWTPSGSWSAAAAGAASSSSPARPSPNSRAPSSWRGSASPSAEAPPGRPQCLSPGGGSRSRGSGP